MILSKEQGKEEIMSNEERPLLQKSSHKAKGTSPCPARHLCLPSKATILIILWTAVVGAIYIIFLSAMVVAVSGVKQSANSAFVVFDSIPFTIIAVVMMFYPLGGFMADICLGRFRVILISLVCILLSLTVVCVIYSTASISHYGTASAFIKGPGTLVILALVLFTIGLVGYQSNFIQFGLDQLLDAPSHYLGLYIHYAMWAFSFAPAIIVTGETFLSCFLFVKGVVVFMGSVLAAIMAILITTLAISWWKHHWFNIQPGLSNPYKTVIKVLYFARNNKYPLQRSAFTYSGIDSPTRLDFAKERYGGPFTTEEVENVKTLFRILSVLLALGPIYTLQLPATVYIFPLFALHTSPTPHAPCSANALWTIILKDGSLEAAMPTLLWPFYIWFIFSVLRKNVPKIFRRLGFGIVVSLLGVATMLIIDVVGHSTMEMPVNVTEPPCMFQIARDEFRLKYQALNMHWSVLIPPSILLGIGPLIVTTSTLEFISAQSPHSMKGLLVGIFFAIQGFFQLIGYIFTLPLSLTHHWTQMPTVISCGFIHLFFTSVVGLVGLVIFIIAVKRYKYRKRDHENFSQHEIEEVYSRYLTPATNSSSNSYAYD